MMFLEISSVIASCGALWKTYINLKRATALNQSAQEHAKASKASAEKAQDASSASRASAEKAAQSAVKAAESSNAFVAIMNAMTPPAPPRSRSAVYEKIARDAGAAEDKDAIKAANLEAQPPAWLKKMAANQ
jgi:N-methylhydantoinase B/oxoprolinase/acetone carboxylase alpha subunit